MNDRNRFTTFAEATSAAQTFCDELSKRYKEKLVEQTSPYIWPSNYASGLGDVCLRRIVLHRTEGDKARPMTEAGAGYVTAGKLYEDPVLDHLKSLGFVLTMNQARLPKNDYNIGAKLDRVVRWNGTEFPADLKTIGAHGFDSITDADSIKNHAQSWYRKYYSQITLYCLLTDTKVGVLIFWDKEGGRVKAVPIPLDLDHGQWLLDRAEEVNRHVRDKTLPEYLKDPHECKQCVFYGRVCDPPMEWGPGARNRPDLLELAEIRETNKPSYEIYKSADDAIKEELRGQELTLIGPFVARGKWQKRTLYEVPEDVKERYKRIDEKAAFRIDIIRVEE